MRRSIEVAAAIAAAESVSLMGVECIGGPLCDPKEWNRSP
jgi:hypothetical protein